ncbi:hypothetical protein LTR10_023978 [Elasticomyces elasticus]|uniref:Uncharacterized protein n=1 Tax=Exophiala sideris TaxID=1016849 RepID=A0ABR0IUG8_9EURO|nr:hypothetical protein LTR10_023978 [Elasticomyces elasticus]KAK5020923.1 hypothetical protein LTS07_011358 [Exophiala sideris]KAK5022985.1 hypothetical protein LTR13_011370 [Exophiala sideris]KAK5048470.1 hypothetical protein LTR69_011338 [Exophiala sideris]KAK5176042.1 hypothetical protein LTR44_011401 [Eurotiomycetes sp. CCFEE 6388]
MSRTMKVGGIPLKQADRPGQFSLEGIWVITISDADGNPQRFGFKTTGFNVEFFAEISAVYTFESLDSGKQTKWSRDRVSTIPKGKGQEVEFLVKENDMEDLYQQTVKKYLKGQS